jgi:hypothetical protein
MSDNKDVVRRFRGSKIAERRAYVVELVESDYK